jgi:hypothetical protein
MFHKMFWLFVSATISPLMIADTELKNIAENE